MTPYAYVSVRVTPRARRDEIEGWQDDVLLVRLRAPPVEGQANLALRRLVAGRLGLAPSRVELVGGDRGRLKRLRITGLTELELRRRLAAGAG